MVGFDRIYLEVERMEKSKADLEFDKDLRKGYLKNSVIKNKFTTMLFLREPETMDAAGETADYVYKEWILFVPEGNITGCYRVCAGKSRSKMESGIARDEGI